MRALEGLFAGPTPDYANVVELGPLDAAEVPEVG